MRLPCRLALLAVLVLAAPALAQDVRNLVINGSFEEDNFNLHGEIMSCPVRPRVTYGQRDGIPDGWAYPAGQAVLSRDRHSGAVALRVLANKVPVTLSPSLHPYAVQMKGQAAMPKMAFSAWVKGSGPNDALEVSLALSVQQEDPKEKKRRPVQVLHESRRLPCPGQWTQVGFPVLPGAIAAALAKQPGPAGLVTATLTLKADSTGAGLLLDDVALLAGDAPAPYTLVPNAGFETLDQRDRPGYPQGWSRPKKNLRSFGSTYYVWRDWFHYFGQNRGASAVDRLVVRAGKQSFRMNVPPGDDRYIESSAILLNQPASRRLVVEFDYNSYLLANLMVQVVDEQGKEVFADNIVPGSSAGWQTYRAEFLPRKAQQKPGAASAGGDLYGPHGAPVALKACRVRIGVKGVNGSAMDDINEWVNVNHAGTCWLDNVVLAETDATAADLKARGLKTFPLDGEAAGVHVERIDLGERLYGENTATVTLGNAGTSEAAGRILMTLYGPFREDDPKKAGYAISASGQAESEPLPQMKPVTVAIGYKIAPHGRTTLSMPYVLTQLLKDWRSEYRVAFMQEPAGGPQNRGPFTQLSLGTWSQQVLVEVQKCYPFADEINLQVFMNIGVAKKTLAQVTELSYTVVRARDNARLKTWTPLGFQAWVAEFNLKPLPEGYQGDNTNFYTVNVPIAELPVHSQTYPVRDHYVLVEGRDQNNRVLFSGRSPRFGRMEAHAEKLAPIKDVKIHPNNYLLVNGKPFFTRGHLWMQQNFGPSPFARKNTDWKWYGFNVRAGVQSPLPEQNPKDPRYGAGVDDLWTLHNTYVGSQMIAPKGPLSDMVRADLHKWLAKPNVLGIHFVPWEGAPQGTPTEAMSYARAIKAEIGSRPLWISAGWYAPAVYGDLPGWEAAALHDWFMPENNAYFQPSQLDREILPRRRGAPCVLGTYPNVFNDTPYNVQRFEHWTEIIRGHTGYMQIGKPGDPSLMAGMNGELRFIESFLFSKDPAPGAHVEPDVPHLVRARGPKTYVLATNAGPIIGGDWEWSTKIKDQGKASHTGAAFWNRLHDYMKDYYSHWYHDGPTFTAARGDRIVQYVYLPKPGIGPYSGRPIDCLLLMTRANGQWKHHAVWGKLDHQAFTDTGVRLYMALDMHQMAWGSLGLGFCGPKGHNPKHPMLLQHTFTAAQFHRLGALPAAGSWARLEVPIEALGLEGKLVDGLGFVSKGGKVWWERTLLLRNGKEEVLCDGSAGIPPTALTRVRFHVAGLKAGTKVKVCFEERDLTAANGYFEDDLSGEPGYRNLWVGLYGDKIGEHGYYGDGVFYNYNHGRVTARLYEIAR
jgi:hypothetical protein